MSKISVYRAIIRILSAVFGINASVRVGEVPDLICKRCGAKIVMEPA